VIEGIPTIWLTVALAVAALVVLGASLRLTALADVIADRTGFGEAVVGAIALGAATSLSGMVVSVTAALGGDAALAFSNGVGGIAVQTLFLAIADLTYRRANLEHAAAEPASLFQATLLLLLLSIPLLAHLIPDITVLGVNPASILLALVYVWGMRVAARVRAEPMWTAVSTDATRLDEPEDEEEAGKSARGAITAFLALMCVLAMAGWVISVIASGFITRFGLSASIVGALMTAVITSLPELVTTLAAVRRGALQLAVGGIIGGNTFDVLFLTASDIGYRQGSLYHAIGPGDLFWLATGLAMTSVLLLGLILRERNGPARIGTESIALIVLYCLAVGLAATQLAL